MKKLIFTISLLILSSIILLAQEDSPAVLEIRNTNPIEPNITEFDIYLKRNSNLWKRFANGTYYLEFKEDFEDQILPLIDPNKFTLESKSDSTDLPLSPGTQGVENLTEYQISTEILPEGLVISIIGPNEFEDAQEVPLNISGEEDLRLGTFRLSSIDPRGSVPNQVKWRTPIDYWQTTAYKNDIQRDFQKIPENEYPDPQEFDRLQVFFVSDNLNLSNPPTDITYIDDPDTDVGIIPRYVDAKYEGNGRIKVSWKTESEQFLHNFVVKRMKKNFYTTVEEFGSLGQFFERDTASLYDQIPDITTGPNSDPKYTNKWKIVATGTTFDRQDDFDIFFWDESTPDRGDWDREEILSDELKTIMSSNGNEDPYPSLIAAEGKSGVGTSNDYSWVDPNQLEKGEWGCYHVSFQDWNGTTYPLGYDCEQVPNSVIAFANAYPNPFETECQVDFELLDDVVNLRLRVVDGIGRIVTHAVGLDGTVLNNVSVPSDAEGDSKPSRYAGRGTHTAKINIPKSSLSQGSYTLIITADPLNDNFVGSSSAVVKLQVTR